MGPLLIRFVIGALAYHIRYSRSAPEINHAAWLFLQQINSKVHLKHILVWKT